MKRPKPFSVGEVRVRAIRGPKDSRWYWRADRYEGTGAKHGIKVWTGWGTKREASQAIAAIVAVGEDTEAGTERRTRSDSVVETVRDLLEFWIGHREGNVRPETLKGDRVSSRRIRALLGDVRVDRLSQVSLETYRSTLLSRDYATGTIYLDFTKLRAAWRWGQELALVPDRDLRLPKLKVEPTMEKYTPTRSEVDAVLQALDQSPRWAKPALLLLAEIGARIGEVASLRWGAIDFERKLVRVDGKTGPRVVPVSAETLLALRGLGVGTPEASIWPVEEATVRRYTGRYLGYACATAGVPRWTPHGFRRYVATRLLDGGVPIHTAQAITGHSAVTMLRYYATATPDGMRAALVRAGLSS